MFKALTKGALIRLTIIFLCVLLEGPTLLAQPNTFLCGLELEDLQAAFDQGAIGNCSYCASSSIVKYLAAAEGIDLPRLNPAYLSGMALLKSFKATLTT